MKERNKAKVFNHHRIWLTVVRPLHAYDLYVAEGDKLQWNVAIQAWYTNLFDMH